MIPRGITLDPVRVTVSNGRKIEVVMRTCSKTLLAPLLILSVGTIHAASAPPEPVESLVRSLFEAVGASPRTCALAPSGIEDRACAKLPKKPGKLKQAWDQALEPHAHEAVTKWHDQIKIHWRYYVIEGRPILVELNGRNKTLSISASLLPRCDAAEHALMAVSPKREVVYKRPFQWPARASITRKSGKVDLVATIDADGNVTGVCGDLLEPKMVDLELAAGKALQSWRFEPLAEDLGLEETLGRIRFTLDFD